VFLDLNCFTLLLFQYFSAISRVNTLKGKSLDAAALISYSFFQINIPFLSNFFLRFHELKMRLIWSYFYLELRTLSQFLNLNTILSTSLAFWGIVLQTIFKKTRQKSLISKVLHSPQNYFKTSPKNHLLDEFYFLKSSFFLSSQKIPFFSNILIFASSD
jgi:hypothetical protein